MLVVGFQGLSPKEPWVQQLQLQVRDGLVGNITLYGRNIESREQVAALNRFFQEAKPDIPLILAVAQEGGQVQRLSAKNGFADFRSAKAVAQEMNPKHAESYYRDMASMVASAGFNMVLAPVVDLDSDQPSPVIGGRERSFSADPDKVAAYAAAFIHAFRSRKLLTCLKHFPGHGRAPGDTHDGWVDATRTWSEDELKPFFKLIKLGQADMIMTAHIFNKRIDPDHVATMSSQVLQGLLRRRGQFKGVIITDALDMGAIQEKYGFQDAVVRAISAGADLLLFPNNPAAKDVIGLKPGPDLPERVIMAVEESVQSGKLTEKRIDASYRRILTLKKALKD